MAHPFNSHRADKQEHARVSKITKACGGGMATGGRAHSDEAEDKALVRRLVKGAALRATGGAVTARADRPGRARGGRLGGKKGTKGTTVNVIIAGGQQKPPVVPGLAPQASQPPALPRPVAPPPFSPGSAPGGPPMGAGPLPPGMPPMRKAGGRVAFSGKTNPSFTAKNVDTRGSASTAEGAGIGKGRTPVQHAPQKDELKQVGRKAVITKATGGPISGEKGPMAPHAKGGAMGGLAKLDKAHHPRKYTKA